MGGLELKRVVDEATAAMWHSVDAATRSDDVPADPLEEVLPRVRATATTGERTELWIGVADGGPVAAGEVMLPSLDNEANATVDVRVVEARRCNGHGVALLTHLLGRARAAGRRRVFGEISEPFDSSDEPPGVAFARAIGARAVLTEVRRKLDLAGVDDAHLDALGMHAQQHAHGYSLVQWLDQAPDEVVDDVAVLMGAMTAEDGAPLEGMAWDAESYDAARVRAREDDAVARGRRRVVTAARHDATGALVAYTDIGVNVGSPRVAYQWDTIVRPDHRGRRLGLLVKAANLRLLRETTPGAAILNTWNAEVNGHMIAINEALGFRAVERERQWELLI